MEHLFEHIEAVEFNVATASKSSYNNFVGSALNLLENGADYQFAIPKLRRNDNQNDPQRYILLHLFNETQRVSVILRRPDLYIMGYRTNGISYFFSSINQAERDRITPANSNQTLTFGFRYQDMEGAAELSTDRREVKLGISALNQSIYCLSRGLKRERRRNVARSLLVVTQMTAEPIRFIKIREILSTNADIGDDGMYKTVLVTSLMIALQTNWENICTAIETRNFANLNITHLEGRVEIHTIKDAERVVSIMLS